MRNLCIQPVLDQGRWHDVQIMAHCWRNQTSHAAGSFDQCSSSPCVMQENGVRRLRAALSANDTEAFTASVTVPLLNYLGSNALCKGSCKAALLALLTTIYHIPGLLECLQTALDKRAIRVCLVYTHIANPTLLLFATVVA